MAIENKNIRVLGIESSCDDTGVAVIDQHRKILANIVISQKNEHELFQGVVPEIAARSHMENLKRAVNLALSDSGLVFGDIDVIAATCGPGLIGGLIVGSMFAKAVASVLKKPFIAVNHLEGHALTVRLTNDLPYPYLLLLASGGHCQYVAVLGLGMYKVLGTSVDDAIGEAFDKVARMLGLGFPGGPEVEKKALTGNENRFDFPLPMIGSKDCNMSFSGLKTAVNLKVQQLQQANMLLEQDICDIAASFQKTVSDIIYKKTKYAIDKYEKIASNKESNFRSLVVSGGVAANNTLRKSLARLAEECSYNFVAPPIKLCTDNAAMIAFAGLERFCAGKIDQVNFKPRARWSLEDL